ncbi:MAG: hypothetical protein D4S02_02685, partial [Rhodocyclaceae bacterium]
MSWHREIFGTDPRIIANETLFDNIPLIRMLATLMLWAGLCGIANAAGGPLPDEIIVKYQSSSRLANHGRV